MRNEKKLAPFYSTVNRFKKQETKLNQSIGPGSYQSEHDYFNTSKS